METETAAVKRCLRLPISRKTVKKVLKIFANALFALLMLFVAIMLYFILQSKASGGAPAIAGQYALVVRSGSMSPKFDMGSVVFVKPIGAEEIKVGDIITFQGFGGSQELTTHRVVGIDKSSSGLKFTTKGDANRVSDPDQVQAKNVIGRVSFSIPWLGYFVNFSQTKYGLFVLIVIPGILLVLSECRNLYAAFVISNKKEKGKSLQVQEPAPEAGKEKP